MNVQYTRSGQKHKLEIMTVEFVAIVKRVNNEGRRSGADIVVPLLVRPTVIDDMGIGWVVREFADRNMIPGHTRHIQVRHAGRVMATVDIAAESDIEEVA